MTKLGKSHISSKKPPATKVIEVKAYGGATLEIRALSILELTKMFLNLKKEGFNLDDFKNLGGSEPSLSSLPMAFDLVSEACKLGIVDKEIRDMVDDFMLELLMKSEEPSWH